MPASGRYKTPIQLRRESLGLTQAEVAAASGVSRKMYQMYERYRSTPNVLNAIRVAIVLRTTVELLWKELVEV